MEKPEKEIVELFKLPVMMWPPMENMNEKQHTFAGACKNLNILLHIE